MRWNIEYSPGRQSLKSGVWILGSSAWRRIHWKTPSGEDTIKMRPPNQWENRSCGHRTDFSAQCDGKALWRSQLNDMVVLGKIPVGQ